MITGCESTADELLKSTSFRMIARAEQPYQTHTEALPDVELKFGAVVAESNLKLLLQQLTHLETSFEIKHYVVISGCHEFSPVRTKRTRGDE